MMRGLFCDGSKVQFRRELPKPKLGPGETLLRVRAVGICDTDLQLAQGYMGFQGILGHEFIGETAGGKRVTAEINNPCNQCATCLAGRPRHCPNRTVLGILNHDGAMADWVAVPTQNLHPVPDTIDDLQAVFIEPLAAAFRILEQIELSASLSFAVLGDGKLGILCAWVARLAGAKVHLIGKHPHKLKLAGPSIETHLIDGMDFGSDKYDIVADCTGSPTGLPAALKLVRPCGTIVLKTTIAGTYEINLAPVVIDEVRIIGSRCGPFPKAIEALARGTIDVGPLIGAIYPLDNAEEAFRTAAAKGSKKVVIQV